MNAANTALYNATQTAINWVNNNVVYAGSRMTDMGLGNAFWNTQNAFNAINTGGTDQAISIQLRPVAGGIMSVLRTLSSTMGGTGAMAAQYSAVDSALSAQGG